MVLAHHRLRRGAAGLLRHRLARPRQDDADQLDRAQRGRRRRLPRAEDLPATSMEVFTTRGPTRCGAPRLWCWPRSIRWWTRSPSRNTARRSRRTSSQAARQTEIERLSTEKEKTGVFTGAYAINPVNDERIPIWIADYVLMGYGTGRDHGRAGPRRARLRLRPEKYDLPIPWSSRPRNGSTRGVPICPCRGPIPARARWSTPGPSTARPPDTDGPQKVTAWLEAEGRARPPSTTGCATG